MKICSQLLTLACVAMMLGNTAQAAEDKASEAWNRLADGTAIAIIRHALAPGFSDPAGFDLGDCSTQRNLSDQGREQARAIGDLFRSNGITDAHVLTSQWCRCRETAQLLNIGTPVDLTSLNSFFENRSAADVQTSDLRKALPKWIQDGSMPTVLITHQVNISALTQQFANSGEILIISLRNGEVTVLESIPTLN